jgi:hypothetical protein
MSLAAARVAVPRGGSDGVCAGLLDEEELTQALTLLNVINVKEVACPLSYNQTSLVCSHRGRVWCRRL